MIAFGPYRDGRPRLFLNADNKWRLRNAICRAPPTAQSAREQNWEVGISRPTVRVDLPPPV